MNRIWPRADQRRGDRREGALALDVLAAALGDRRRAGHQERAAVDPLAQAARGELAEVAADRVLGDPELDGEIGGDDAAVAAQPSHDAVLALARQRGVGGRLGRHHCTTDAPTATAATRAATPPSASGRLVARATTPITAGPASMPA